MKPNRIHLINCDEKLLKTILKGDVYLSKELGIKIPDSWSESGSVFFEYVLKKLAENPAAVKWYCYLPIESKTSILLGSCGYKGPPDENGIVEIGYEVAKDYRNQGYATEITAILIKKAFADNVVKKIQAHTLAAKNASVRVLEKCKFKFIAAYYDDEDGLIWKWMKER